MKSIELEQSHLHCWTPLISELQVNWSQPLYNLVECIRSPFALSNHSVLKAACLHQHKAMLAEASCLQHWLQQRMQPLGILSEMYLCQLKAKVDLWEIVFNSFQFSYTSLELKASYT